MKCLILVACVYACSAAPQSLVHRLNGAIRLGSAGGYALGGAGTRDGAGGYALGGAGRSNIFSQEPISVAEAQSLVKAFTGSLDDILDLNLPNGVLSQGTKADSAARTLLSGAPTVVVGTNLVVYPNGAVVPADEPSVAAIKAGFGAAHLFAEINGY